MYSYDARHTVAEVTFEPRHRLMNLSQRQGCRVRAFECYNRTSLGEKGVDVGDNLTVRQGTNCLLDLSLQWCVMHCRLRVVAAWLKVDIDQHAGRQLRGEGSRK